MKRYQLTINILLIFIFVASIVAFAVLCRSTYLHWDIYHEASKLESLDDNIIREINSYLSETLRLTFSVIFSSLVTVASAITLILLNLDFFKKKETQKDE